MDTGASWGQLAVLLTGGRMFGVMFYEEGDLDLDEQIGVGQTMLSRRNVSLRSSFSNAGGIKTVCFGNAGYGSLV